MTPRVDFSIYHWVNDKDNMFYIDIYNVQVYHGSMGRNLEYQRKKITDYLYVNFITCDCRE